MQLRAVIAGSLICLIPAAVLAAGVTRTAVPATVTAVTVYQDRALVTRAATVALKPGSHLVAVEGLPVLLQEDSVRVEAKGPPGTVITGIEVKRSFLSQSADRRIRELDEEIRLLERKLGSLDARKAGLITQKGFVDSIKVAWGERISQQLAVGKPTAAELNEALGFVGSTTVKIEDQQQEIEQEKLTVRAQVDALKRKRQEAAGPHRKESKTVEVSLEVAREGRLDLELSGLVGQAAWEPAYDVRLAPDGSSAELTYRAQVRQQTGEDWNNAALTLSTARPAGGGAPPALYPWRISFQRLMPAAAPAPRVEERFLKRSLRNAPAESVPDMAAAEESPEPAAFQTARTVNEGTAVAFRVPKPVDIPSDNSRHSTVIAHEKLAVSTEYLAVPKLTPLVFLSAELVNRAPWPLLPGQVRIFIGTTFVGSAEMRQTASGEKFTLPFGSDDQVTVRRDEQRQHTEAGIFGRNRMAYRVTATVANFRKEPQQISVKDQLPLSGDQEIKVSLEDAAMPPTEQKDDGTLIWKLKLGPGEKKELRYVIVVDYPKGREVTGL